MYLLLPVWLGEVQTHSCQSSETTMVTQSQQIDVLGLKVHVDQRSVEWCLYMEWKHLLGCSPQAQICDCKRIYIKMEAGNMDRSVSSRCIKQFFKIRHTVETYSWKQQGLNKIERANFAGCSLLYGNVSVRILIC